MRERLAFWLIEKALWLLPVSSSARTGMLRGLREQRQYDRYEGFCELTLVSPLPFDRWREVWQTLRVKAAGAEQANAARRSGRRGVLAGAACGRRGLRRVA